MMTRYEYVVKVRNRRTGEEFVSDVYDVPEKFVDKLPSQDEYPLGEQVAIELTTILEGAI